MPPVADNKMFDSNKIQVLYSIRYTEESINTYNTGDESE